MKRRNWIPIILPCILAAVLLLGAAMDGMTGEEASDRIPTSEPAKVRHVNAAVSEFDALFDHGVALLQTGKHDHSVKIFEMARQLRPHVPEVHSNLGYSYLKSGRYVPAEAAFQRATNLRPELASAYYGWAESLELLGDLEAARGAMRTFIHLTPESDPFRRRALSALWEWETVSPVSPESKTPEKGESAALLETKSRHSGTDPLQVGQWHEGFLADLTAHHGRTVVLNVWATWCPPCRTELPSLQRLSERLDPKQYSVVGLAVDEEPAFVAEFLRDSGVRFPNFLDAGGEQAAAVFGVESYPQTLILGPEGELQERITGAHEWDSKEMIDRIVAHRESESAPAKLSVFDSKTVPLGEWGERQQP